VNEFSIFARQPALPKRAYQLARSGACKSVAQIGQRLTSEGYPDLLVENYLRAKAARADLAYICQVADQRW
jgi:hypothetical protein